MPLTASSLTEDEERKSTQQPRRPWGRYRRNKASRHIRDRAAPRGIQSAEGNAAVGESHVDNAVSGFPERHEGILRSKEMQVADLVSSAVQRECEGGPQHGQQIDFEWNVINLVFGLVPARIREAVMAWNVLQHVDDQQNVERLRSLQEIVKVKREAI